MPVETRISPAFGQLVKQALGTDSFSAASIKARISPAWLMQMSHGRVPGEQIIKRFADAYEVDLEALRIAAGYEQPSNSLSGVELALRHSDDISDVGKEQILQFVRETKEKYGVADRSEEHDE